MTDNPGMQNSTPLAPSPRKVFNGWMALAIGLFIALLFAVAAAMSVYEQGRAQILHLQKQLSQQPQVKYLAVLTDAQGTPGLLVTLDPAEGALALQRVGSVTEGREDALQLWGVNDKGKAHSLGLLARGVKTLRIAVQDEQLRGVVQLGLSVEVVGGAPDERGPSLPWLFKGAWVQKAL